MTIRLPGFGLGLRLRSRSVGKMGPWCSRTPRNGHLRGQNGALVLTNPAVRAPPWAKWGPGAHGPRGTGTSVGNMGPWCSRTPQNGHLRGQNGTLLLTDPAEQHLRGQNGALVLTDPRNGHLRGQNGALVLTDPAERVTLGIMNLAHIAAYSLLTS